MGQSPQDYIAVNFGYLLIRQAKEDWIHKKFPKVDGNETYIAIPKL